jgi:sterol 14-demethylase
MDMTIGAVWWALALFFITAIIIKIANRRSTFGPVCTSSPPPVVSGIALLGILRSMCTKGPEATWHSLYNKFGSVFTVKLLWKRTTFLVGSEVSGSFFQGLESEVSQGNINEFTVPMFGQEVGFGVDYTTRMEQTRFFIDALKPSQLRSHVSPMLHEVENYFGKWGEEGVVDLKHEFEQILMLISSRCLIGNEVREKMYGQFYTLFSEIEKGMNLVSFMFPYIPIAVNRRRDRARVKLIEILSEIVRSRKSCNRVEDDVLQRLMDSMHKGGCPTTEAEVTGMIIGLIFAGKHTSSFTTTWAGACLLSHQKFLDAAIDEQKQIMKKHNDKLDYNILSEMETLHACIKEAARLHPALPMLVRKARKGITVQTKEGNQYAIPNGDSLVSLVVLNNNLSHIYKDPEVYDPYRFLPGREEDKVGGKFSYATFGGGRHACTGEAYAFMQIKIIWSHLLRNFELKLMSAFPEPDWSKFVLEPKGKVMVNYKRYPAASI